MLTHQTILEIARVPLLAYLPYLHHYGSNLLIPREYMFILKRIMKVARSCPNTSYLQAISSLFLLYLHNPCHGFIHHVGCHVTSFPYLYCWCKCMTLYHPKLAKKLLQTSKWEQTLSMVCFTFLVVSNRCPGMEINIQFSENIEPMTYSFEPQPYCGLVNISFFG